ncbi:putative cyclophilin precursor [Paratrimastix pyriformis]|uniref:Peptidyl-prolyl cis-trans isomerase n=1 Tax=Paratrimastix pyriformis TaxID=342808 RepID=A0ABQ8UFE9_9EUKA|nr:putative cyclophilin precursor [Paratrimastix pyriformis]
MDFFALLPDDLLELILKLADLRTFWKSLLINCRFSSLIRRNADLCLFHAHSLDQSLKALPTRCKSWFQYYSQYFSAFVDVERHNNPFVFLNVAFDDHPEGTIVIELYAHDTPRTAENFLRICVGDTTRPDGTPRTYAGTPFHRIMQWFVAQGGDIINHNGTGSDSIYGETFPDEISHSSHNRCFTVSMAGLGRPNSNGCQFFITLATGAVYLDKKHVAFGLVVNRAGRELVQRMAERGLSMGHPSAPS